MGFLFGKKKSADDAADDAADQHGEPAAKKASARKPIKPSGPAPTTAGSAVQPSTERRSRRIVAAGGTAPKPSTGASRKPATQMAETDSINDDLELELPPPLPTAAPAKPTSREPITSSNKPNFAGSVAASRPKGPARSGDAALIEFLKTKANLINDDQAGQLKSKAEQDNLALDVAGVAMGLFSEEQLVNALTQECWVPHLKVDKYEIRKKALDTLTREDAEHFGAFPVDKLGSLLTLAMVNPLDAETIRALEAKTGLDIKKVVATRGEINQAIDKYYGGKVQAKDTSLSFSQDIEPKSLTQLMGTAGSSSGSASLVADLTPEIQDIDDLLSADEAIAPAILEPVKLFDEPMMIPAGDVLEIVEDSPALEARTAAPQATDDLFLDDAAKPAASGELSFDDLDLNPPAKPAPPKPLSVDFDLDDTGPGPSHEPVIAPATSRTIPKPAPIAATSAPARASSPAKPAPRPAATAKTSVVNLIPVMEDEFQHAITHGKSHVFEKWVGLQSRNRIINAQAVEADLEGILAGLYATPRR